MDKNELEAWLRLTLSPGIGNEALRKLLVRFGLPQSVFGQTDHALGEVLSVSQIRGLRNRPEKLVALLEQTWCWLTQDLPADAPVRSIVTPGDAHYPVALLDLPDPPLMLYLLGASRHIQGSHSNWGMRAGLAMVGSRNPTPQGARHAREFARSLRQAGMTIVSGMALGIDAQAHEGALSDVVHGKDVPLSLLDSPCTVAVVGTGLDRVYPARNRGLAHRIAQHGVVVSEYPLGTPPLASNFPRRNRIISGLAQGTLVVEAALASGSLITARLGVEQGREVFAIPGSIDSPQSRGCHALIRQGAKLVETVQDVLEELRIPLPLSDEIKVPMATAAAPEKTLPKPELLHGVAHNDEAVMSDAKVVLECMGFEAVSLEEIAVRSGLSVAAIQIQLLELELMDKVARLPGNLFQRTERA